jgi:hypothetical protein
LFFIEAFTSSNGYLMGTTWFSNTQGIIAIPCFYFIRQCALQAFIYRCWNSWRFDVGIMIGNVWGHDFPSYWNMCLIKRSEFVRYFEQSYFTKFLQHNVDLVCCASAHTFAVWRVYICAKFIISFMKFCFTSKHVLIGLIFFQVSFRSPFVPHIN